MFGTILVAVAAMLIAVLGAFVLAPRDDRSPAGATLLQPSGHLRPGL